MGLCLGYFARSKWNWPTVLRRLHSPLLNTHTCRAPLQLRRAGEGAAFRDKSGDAMHFLELNTHTRTGSISLPPSHTHRRRRRHWQRRAANWAQWRRSPHREMFALSCCCLLSAVRLCPPGGCTCPAQISLARSLSFSLTLTHVSEYKIRFGFAGIPCSRINWQKVG